MSIETEIKKLRFRANHRGIKEMDLVLGRFADERLAGLQPDQLSAFAELLEESDQDLMKWITSETGFPHDHLRDIFNMLRDHATGLSRDE